MFFIGDFIVRQIDNSKLEYTSINSVFNSKVFYLINVIFVNNSYKSPYNRQLVGAILIKLDFVATFSGRNKIY